MSKFISISGGHGGDDPGAVGNGFKERELTIELANLIIKYLKEGYTGFTFKVQQEKVSPSNFRRPSDYGLANGFYMSIHFNAGGGHGTEILQGKFGSRRCKIINDVLSKYFTNRGIKTPNTNDYFMLREADMDMIVEICFIDSKSDMDEYEKNKNKIAKDIADAIARSEGLTKKEATVEDKYYFEIIEKLRNGYVLKPILDTYIFNDFEATSKYTSMGKGSTPLSTTGGAGTNDKGYYMHKTIIHGNTKYVALKKLL